jgi:hypothetical protein
MAHSSTNNPPRQWIIKTTVILSWIIIIIVPCFFLSNLLIGEEGMFAYLVVDNGKAKIPDIHHALLIGREKGIDRFDAPRHPIFPYVLMVKALRPFSDGRNFDRSSIGTKSQQARIPFYIMYVLALCILLYMGIYLFKAKHLTEILVPMGLLVFIGTSRLIVGSATQTFYDGNLGILLASLCALGLTVAPRLSHTWTRAFILFGGGFAASLGKNEWALALLAAIAISVFIRCIYRKLSKDESIKHSHRSFIIIISLAGGVMVGSLFQYLLDPFNYISGFRIMYDFGIAEHSDWKTVFLSRVIWIWPIGVLILLAALVVKKAFKELLTIHFTHFILLMWGITMFAGFLFTSHFCDGFPRYFALPMFILLTFLLVRGNIWKNISRGLTACLGIFFLTSVLFNLYYLYDCHAKNISIGSIPGRSLKDHRQMILQDYRQFRLTRKAKKTDASAAYYFPKMDFINNT